MLTAVAKTNAQAGAGLSISKMVEMMASIPQEPISAWMREKGCDPATGWVLLLPESMAEQLRPYVPECVRLSPLIPKPMLVFAPELLPPMATPLRW